MNVNKIQTNTTQNTGFEAAVILHLIDRSDSVSIVEIKKEKWPTGHKDMVTAINLIKHKKTVTKDSRQYDVKITQTVLSFQNKQNKIKKAIHLVTKGPIFQIL